VAQLTRGALRAAISARCGVNNDSGSDSEAYLNQDLNTAAKRVFGARPWIERVSESLIFTVAPYTTGTVAITQASTSVTGSGTTWTSAFSGRKLALSLGSPWYRFTRTANTTGTIPTGGYAESTVTAATYTLFQDEYDLSGTFESITSAQILSPLHRGGMDPTTEAEMDDLWYVHGHTSTPTKYAPVLATTAGIRRIRLWPIPDGIYRVRVRGLISYRDMTQDGDLCLLGPKKERALMLAACLEVQRRGDGRQVTSDQEVEAAIDEQWQAEAPKQPMSVTRTPTVGSRRFTFFMRDAT